MLWLDGRVAGIVSDFPSLLEAMTGVEGQFLIEGRFEHSGVANQWNPLPILGFSSSYCQP